MPKHTIKFKNKKTAEREAEKSIKKEFCKYCGERLNRYTISPKLLARCSILFNNPRNIRNSEKCFIAELERILNLLNLSNKKTRSIIILGPYSQAFFNFA